MIDQYQGGMRERKAEIEAGATRGADKLIADVLESSRAVDATWRKVPTRAWSSRSRDAKGWSRPLFELPSRRWQEVEVHLVDLDIGFTHSDWSDDFVLEWLPRTRERMWALLPTDTPVLDNPSEELAWFYGRFSAEGSPSAPTWG